MQRIEQPPQPRHFSHVKFVLLLAMVMQLMNEDDSIFLMSYFSNDLQYCPDCFNHQRADCVQLMHSLEFNDDASWANFINSITTAKNRRTMLFQVRNAPSIKLVGKFLAKNEMLLKIGENFTSGSMLRIFADPNRLDGLQVCPIHRIQRFISFWEPRSPQIEIITYMLHKFDPILMPYLREIGFPVPAIYATCGFTTFQEYAGRPLLYYYRADFQKKVQIAIQLLVAATKFSYGFDQFRLYITDFTGDNVVYNELERKVYFIDLDSMLVVDTEATQPSLTGTDLTTEPNAMGPGEVHRHEFIQCQNCFAYQPEDICAHKLSDINLFSVCQFLRENLNCDRTEGFLYPVPELIMAENPELGQFLDECVDCPLPGCQHRFEPANKLLTLLRKLSAAG